MTPGGTSQLLLSVYLLPPCIICDQMPSHLYAGVCLASDLAPMGCTDLIISAVLATVVFSPVCPACAEQISIDL